MRLSYELDPSGVAFPLRLTWFRHSAFTQLSLFRLATTRPHHHPQLPPLSRSLQAASPRRRTKPARASAVVGFELAFLAGGRVGFGLRARGVVGGGFVVRCCRRLRLGRFARVLPRVAGGWPAPGFGLAFCWLLQCCKAVGSLRPRRPFQTLRGSRHILALRYSEAAWSQFIGRQEHRREICRERGRPPLRSHRSEGATFPEGRAGTMQGM